MPGKPGVELDDRHVLSHLVVTAQFVAAVNEAGVTLLFTKRAHPARSSSEARRRTWPSFGFEKGQTNSSLLCFCL